jgi:hypothetical protein
MAGAAVEAGESSKIDREVDDGLCAALATWYEVESGMKEA